MITKFQLSRLSFLIRKHLHKALLDEAAGMRIDVAAEEMSDGIAVYIRAQVLGQQKSRTIYLDTPDGPFQALLACFGLPHRKKQVRLDAFVLFPEIAAMNTPHLYLEVDHEQSLDC